MGSDLCPDDFREGGLRAKNALVAFLPDLPEGESWQQILDEIHNGIVEGDAVPFFNRAIDAVTISI